MDLPQESKFSKKINLSLIKSVIENNGVPAQD